MRKISLKCYQPGMKLAKNIYTEDGRTLLAAGVELKQSYVDRLEQCNISGIYIEDAISKDILVKDVIDDRTRVQAKVLVKNLMEEYKATTSFNSDHVKRMVDNIIDELLNNREIMVNLSDIKSTDDYTFAHSVNVCILSIILGIKLGLNQLRLRDLGVGALLHDIGKVVIPEEILKKPAHLTEEEFEIVKKHTTAGHEILKSKMDISASSAYIAIGHHERMDGRGYPMGLKGENIHSFARIVAIADVFDALTSDRVYRKKMQPHEAVEYMTTVEKDCFDMSIFKYFVQSIALYAIGTSVMLDTGEKGIVVDINRQLPTRPIVRIVYRADGAKVEDFQEIDLTKKLNTFIVGTCEL